jgi:transcriptional regulator with XRE-family HTH domain
MDDSLSHSLGERLRRLRTDRGLGLREEAREIGISASSLSALENNRGGVSLQRLQKVADHFGLHITDLLAENGKPDAAADGEAHVEVLGHGGSHEIQPYLISFEPGGSYSNDPISHTGEEFAYVVLGAVELLLGDEVISLGQGDAVRFRPDTPHAFRNASSAGMAILIGAATPPW